MQDTDTHRRGITFAVDDVTPANRPLGERRMHEAIRRTLESEIESCSDYHRLVVEDVNYQPLLAAVYLAFSQHRPLVLSPDAVWITIAQGVAHHMAVHAEELRSRFVSHQGKLDLVFECEGWVEGSPENPWPEAFAAWSGQIREHVGAQVHDVLVCDFTTSGAVEHAASQIVMMDIFQRYFRYELCCICGIPSVTLEGAPADWERLAQKVRGLRIFDMDWWLDHLDPICDQFVRASKGDIDLPHWHAICKRREVYGGEIINGWVAKLFPYLRESPGGECARRNSIFQTGQGFTTSIAPSGLSRVPFTWVNRRTKQQRQMEAIGGLVGIEQGSPDLALRPIVGWAVRPAEKFDVLLHSLAQRHRCFAGLPTHDHDPRTPWFKQALPSDLVTFYHRSNGAELLDHAGRAAVRIVPFEQIEPLDSGENPGLRAQLFPEGRIWQRIAWLADGSWLAINLETREEDLPLHTQRMFSRFDHRIAAICHGRRSGGRSGIRRRSWWGRRKFPVVALSFTELLAGLIDYGGRPYWLEPGFADYGDAETYTRRD